MIPSAPNDAVKTVLERAISETPPPASLRDRVLRRHHRRRQLSRSAPLAAVVITAACAWWLMPGSRPSAGIDWHARSVALEASWRESGDAGWLRADARAEPLLLHLHEVDTRLAGLLQEPESSDPAVLAQLWKERSETLSVLIETRRQGGLAMRL